MLTDENKDGALLFVEQLNPPTKIVPVTHQNVHIAFTYSRYSTHLQNEVSIEIQEEVHAVYCTKHRLEPRGKFADRAVTGRIEKRPGLEDCLRACEAHPGCNLVVYDVDRLYRSDEAYHAIQTRLERAKVRLHDRAGELSAVERHMYAAIASIEMQKMVERLTAGRIRAVKAGVPIGPAPFGYQKEGKRLKIDTSTAEIVRVIFARAAEGATVASIVRYLEDELNVSTPGGAARWQRSTVARMLRSPTYVGVVTYEVEE